MRGFLLSQLLLLCGAYETRFFNQSLTHSSDDNRRFKQRYLFDNESWGKNAVFSSRDCPGPILFYTGNEGPIDEFYAITGFVTEVLKRKLGALVVFAEERYYGESLPFGEQSFDSGDNAQWLQTRLVLLDYVALIESLNPNNACPVVAFGGSYGGTLTTLLRVAHPAVTVGGLAASAPLGYYDPRRWEEFGVSSYTWSDLVYQTYDEAVQGCGEAVEEALVAIRTANTSVLVEAFEVCDSSALGVSDPTELFAYALEGGPQGDYPPDWPITAACRALIAGPSLEAAANLTKTAFASSFVGGCLPRFAQGPGGIPGDGPGDRSAWGVQSCLETLHLFQSRSPIRRYSLDIEAINARCLELFGFTPNTTKLTDDYGGYDIPNKATNLIFSNGRLDPWHGGGFLKQHFPDAHPSISFCFMTRGAHHVDLRKPTPEDPPDVTECRQLEERIIRGWIDAFFQERKQEGHLPVPQLYSPS